MGKYSKFDNQKYDPIAAAHKREVSKGASLKKEWLSLTFELRSELGVTADMLHLRYATFIFTIGKITPLATINSPRGNGYEIKFLSSTPNGPLDSLTTFDPNWSELMNEVVSNLRNRKSEFKF